MATGQATLRQAGAARARRRFPRPLGAYAYLLPASLLLAAFQVYPLFYGAYVSLHRWGLVPGEFVGLANYRAVLADPDFWHSLLVTLFYVLGTVPVEMILGFALAWLLFQPIRGRALFRLLYFLPYVTSMVALGLVWSWIFNANFGLLNALLRLLHLAPLNWLLEPRGILTLLRGGTHLEPWTGGPSLALLCVAAVTVWYYAGLHAVVYLAGLSAVPREVLEAARIDGAAGWRLLRRVILPLLSPTTYFLAVVATVGAFQSFALVYTLTAPSGGGAAGGPLETTKVVTLYIFNAFYSEFRVGYAQAAAFLLFVLLLGLTLLQMRFAARRVTYLGGLQGGNEP
ncbi:MAG: sugar ABC transporter permease [Bacillota bacterium]|nr:sugar ABC transporter permease [Bacillota bacterium]